jgi:hypothetical protein
MSDSNKTCSNCKFSRTIKTIDPIVYSRKDEMHNACPGLDIKSLYEHEIVYCHIKGPPQKISNPNMDWCYSWEEINSSK